VLLDYGASNMFVKEELAILVLMSVLGDCLASSIFVREQAGPDLSMGKVGSCPRPPHFRGPLERSF